MKRILIVDDNQDIRDLVTMTLRRASRHVLEAATGQEAIDLAREHKPDLIMMDIVMPGSIDGLEATRVLKGDPQTKSCRIILLTSMGLAIDKKLGYEAGADDYLVKPFSPLELMRKVDSFLEG